MSWPLYIDQHVPAAISEGLRRRGGDVLTAFEDGTAEWEDTAILRRADELGRILFFTQDRDFLQIAAEWQVETRSFHGIVFCPQQRYPHSILVDWLELVTEALGKDELRDQVVFIPMK